jgi:primosomal protein N' (replication factor Y)
MPNRNARNLRMNMTDAEMRLWKILRDRNLDGLKFRRQRPVGPFIADFACVEERLIVEVDGGQHNGSASDARRTAWLQSRGWRVLRFWNDEVLRNVDGVCEQILSLLK